MENLTRDQLFSLFRTEQHGKLAEVLEKPAVSGLAVYENADGRRRAVPTGQKPVPETDDGYALFGVYHKPTLDTSLSRTMAALEYLKANPKESPYAVAKMFGITPGAVYKARKRREGKVICPCCGQTVREGFVVDEGV